MYPCICKKRNTDGGYSLIELITVISIVAVMVGLISLGVSLMFSRDAEYVAKVIDDELSETRMLAMSKAGKYEMILHIDSTGANNYIAIKKDSAEPPYKKIEIKKKAKLTVKYGATTVTSGDVTFEFDKGNGSVKVPVSTGVCTVTATSTKLTTKTSTVDIAAATGRHYVRK